MANREYLNKRSKGLEVKVLNAETTLKQTLRRSKTAGSILLNSTTGPQLKIFFLVKEIDKLTSNPLFYRRGQNVYFRLRSGSKFQEGKNDFRKIAVLLCYFTQRLVSLLVKSVDISDLCCIIASGDYSKMGKTLLVFCFFTCSLCACDSKSIQDILISF